MRRALVLLLLALGLLSCRRTVRSAAAEAPPAPPAVPSSPLAAPGRLVAVGDLHGDLVNARRTLRMAGLVDEYDRWIAGNAWLVQTGDLTDKGPDTRGVLDLFQSLERQAAEAGGRVIVLVSNHEALSVAGESASVSPDDVLDFGPGGNTGRTAEEADFGELEAAAANRREALGPTGEYGRWILSHDAIVVVGDAVFLHGGLTPEEAVRGVASLNDEVRTELAAGRYAGVVANRDGPLWFRGYVSGDEAEACPRLERALAAVGAARMVVGHTPQRSGRIGARCGGRLLAIDTGIAAVMGGAPSALELTGGDARAIHPDGVADLPDP